MPETGKRYTKESLVRRDASDARALSILGWVVSFYVASTIVESTVFSLNASRVSRLMAVLVVVTVLWWAINNKIPRFGNFAVLGISGIFALMVTSVLWMDGSDLALTRSVTFGALAATSAALAAAFACLGADAVERVRVGLVLGAASASFLVILARVQGDYAGAQEFQQLTMRSSAGAADPNDLALLLAAAVPACIWSPRITVRLLVSGLAVTGVLLTGSRGAMLSLACGAAFALAFLLVSRGAKAIPSLVVSGTTAVIFIWLSLSVVPEVIVERIQRIPEELSSGSYTNRTYLWQAAWDQFSENPFLGSGVGTARHYIFERSGWDLVAHNTHLSFLVEIGILGWIFFACSLVVAWAGVLSVWRLHTWPAVMLAVLTVGTLSLSWEFNKLLWVVLVFGGFLWAGGLTRTECNSGSEPATIDRSIDNQMRAE